RNENGTVQYISGLTDAAWLAYIVSQDDPSRASTLRDEGYQIAQWAMHSHASSSLSGAAGRLLLGDEPLRLLSREYLHRRFLYLDAESRLIGVLSQPESEHRNAE